MPKLCPTFNALIERDRAQRAVDSAKVQLDGFAADFTDALKARPGPRPASLGSAMANELRRRWTLLRQTRKARRGNK